MRFLQVDERGSGLLAVRLKGEARAGTTYDLSGPPGRIAAEAAPAEGDRA